MEKSKLDSRCTKGIFFGYNKGSLAYLVYIPETGKVIKHGVVKFSKPKQCVSEQKQMCDDDFIQLDTRLDEPPNGSHPAEGGPEQGTGDPKSVLPEHVAGNTRYPRRERKTPVRLGDYATGNDFEEDDDDDQVMSSIDYCCTVSAFPQNYKEAITSPESEHWKNAMEEEINSLKENPDHPARREKSRGRSLGVHSQGKPQWF